jgi:hypothetical protein
MRPESDVADQWDTSDFATWTTAARDAADMLRLAEPQSGVCGFGAAWGHAAYNERLTYLRIKIC